MTPNGSFVRIAAIWWPADFADPQNGCFGAFQHNLYLLVNDRHGAEAAMAGSNWA